VYEVDVLWKNERDLWFEAVNDQVRFLVPINGAAASIVGNNRSGIQAALQPISLARAFQ